MSFTRHTLKDVTLAKRLKFHLPAYLRCTGFGTDVPFHRCISFVLSFAKTFY